MRPRIRTIKPEFYGDPRVCGMSRDARYTAIGLVSAADDRGRLEYSVAAIRGLVFPRDNVRDGRVEAWVGEVVDARLALAYEVDGWTYLWLPNFWRHQVINRPSESLLPPHPDDPYGHLPVVNALAQFREDSLRNHGGLIPSRAGARSGSLSPSCSSSEPETPVVAREAERHPRAAELCRLLAELIAQHDPNAKPTPETDRWVRDMRLLIADRGGNDGEVERVIRWCQADPFWHSNILSPRKLRKQFTQLVLKANRNLQAVPASHRRESPSDMLRAIRGGELAPEHVIEGSVAS